MILALHVCFVREVSYILLAIVLLTLFSHFLSSIIMTATFFGRRVRGPKILPVTIHIIIYVDVSEDAGIRATRLIRSWVFQSIWSVRSWAPSLFRNA